VVSEDLSHKKVEAIEKGEHYQTRRPVKQGLIRVTPGDPDEHYLDVRTEEVGYDLVVTYTAHVEQKSGMASWTLSLLEWNRLRDQKSWLPIAVLPLVMTSCC
jgi:hypothetical protein